MKTTKYHYGHKWTMVELSRLMELWEDKESLADIASIFNSTPRAIRHIVQRLRSNGVPLTRRTKGHISGRSNQLWTQGEVEYLLRRRAERATNEEVAMELGRSECAISGIVSKLRAEDVPVAMRGNGVRRLWDSNSLKAVSTQI